ncbi:MAG: glycosyltransferase family 4 protein [Anaerolineae bacterium]
MTLLPDNITFCLLSFEGPDLYSQAGGLGIRVSHLAETLARLGFETHLLFVGDPGMPGLESRLEGRLTLHRWCQWISAYHPAGVYDAEEAKLWDFGRSVPPFVIERIIRPALEAGRLPVILAEEWHTAETLIRISDQLQAANLRQWCVLFWNANNTMSFHRVDWSRLNAVARLTTVSRYMKHLMWTMGLNPLVISNGIPGDLLKPVNAQQVAALKRVLDVGEDALVLFKVGRFDPAKCWLTAVEAAAQLKAAGYRVIFPARGGIEPHGVQVLAQARNLGLSVTDVTGEPASCDEVLALLQAAAPADLYNLRFPMTQAMLRPFYVAADAVLANSGREPFGLVGLEAMAAGGLVFTGATGEEYVTDGQNAVMLDTDLPQEIVAALLDLQTHSDRAEAMRRAARETAAIFTWKRISTVLLEKVEFAAKADGAIPSNGNRHSHRQPGHVRDVVYALVHQPQQLHLAHLPEVLTDVHLREADS